MVRTAGHSVPVMDSGLRPDEAHNETTTDTAPKTGLTGTTHAEAKVETKVKATPKHAATHAATTTRRHAGPYGASFDGTAPDASRPVA